MEADTFSLSGELVEGGHRLAQRVYYEDTDFSGLVYHARYLHFLERGRTDYLRCLGCEQSALVSADEEGLVFVVYRMEIDFKQPARMDDILIIQTMTGNVGRAKMVLNQEIRRGDAVLIAAKVVIAVVNRHGRLRALPETVAEKFLGHPVRGNRAMMAADGRKKFLYDPPRGWQYGFPKPYLPLEGERIEDTLLRDGYPAALISEGWHKDCRFIEMPVKDEPDQSPSQG